MLLSLTIIAVAVVVLVRMLRDIDVDEVIAALKATAAAPHRRRRRCSSRAAISRSPSTTWFALRTIGHNEIPYRIAALSGFTSYSIGHNIGATVFTGGAVRYRIYSALRSRRRRGGEDLFRRGPDVLARQRHRAGPRRRPFAAGRGLASINCRLGSTAAWRARCLLILACYLGWVWSAPREIGRGEWKVNLPNGPSTLLQICIGIIDLGCCALAMYMLLPTEPNIGFVTLAVVFVSATHARLRQPRARRPRRVRRRHAGGAVAIRQGRFAGRAAAVPAALLFRAVRRCADYSGHARNYAQYARRAARSADRTR